MISGWRVPCPVRPDWARLDFVKRIFALVAAVSALFAPSVCLADAGGPVLFLALSSVWAFSLGEILAVVVEFLWLAALFKDVGRARVLWWAVVMNFASTVVGCAIVMLLMPLHFKFFGVGELTRVWMAVWFALSLIPAYIVTVWIEMRILTYLTRNRVVLFFDNLLRAVLYMNAVSFTGLALIFTLFVIWGW